jgi:hypothetical protein
MFLFGRDFLGRQLGYRSLVLTFVGLMISLTAVLFSTLEPMHLDDGLRHITFAAEIFSEGVKGWKQYFFAGYFADRDFDPWVAAHLTYLPFVFFGPVVGLKLVTLTYALALGLTFTLLLNYFRVPARQICFLLVFLVWGSVLFNWRLLSARPLILTSALLLLVLWAVLGRRSALVMILLAFATLFSHLFVFVGVTALLGSFWLFGQGKASRAAAWRMLAACLVGPVLGLVLHPEPGRYLTYLYEVFLVIPVAKPLGLGTEFTPGLFIPDPSVLVLGAILLGFCWEIKGRISWTVWARTPTFFLLVTTFSFGFCWLFWVRAVDFFWPLSLAAAGVAWQFNRTLGGSQRMENFLRAMLPVACLFCVVHWSARVLSTVEEAPLLPIASYRLDLPPGARVFNLDWELFAPLFFHRPDLKYARGMDPTFDHIANPENAKLLDEVLLAQPPATLFWGMGLELLAGNKTVLYPQENTNLDGIAWINRVLEAYQPDFIVLHATRHTWLAGYMNRHPDLKSVSAPAALKVYRVESTTAAPKAD